MFPEPNTAWQIRFRRQALRAFRGAEQSIRRLPLAGWSGGVRTQKTIAAAMAALMTLVASGLPLPSPTLVAADGVPFPCQDHACGCHSADQCLRACCCHTAAERVAWYQALGMTPPEQCLLAAERESRQMSAAPRSCCAAKPQSACCASGAREECCEPRASDEPGIALLQALGCRGESGLFHALPPGVRPTLVESSFQLAPSRERWIVDDERFASRSIGPDPRPPCLGRALAI